jgi:hypothetical protein
MTHSSMHPPDTDPRGCLQLVQAFQQEIRAAVRAISQNALTDLELSLWRQEMLCARLKRSMGPISSYDLREPLHGVLREALVDLKTESDRYERVVLRCSRSVIVLQDLCALYRGTAPGSRANKLSFSCEV